MNSKRCPDCTYDEIFDFKLTFCLACRQKFLQEAEKLREKSEAAAKIAFKPIICTCCPVHKGVEK
jgi:hypothetical protein